MKYTPRIRVVNSFYELKIPDRIPTKGWREGHGEFLEALELRTKLNTLDVIDNIQQSYTGTCIVRSLRRI